MTKNENEIEIPTICVGCVHQYERIDSENCSGCEGINTLKNN